MKAFTTDFGVKLSRLLPSIAALWTFCAGVALLFAGTLPPRFDRLKTLREIVLLPVFELSHFAGSIVGTLLLFLAWGLARRLHSAWVAAVAATCAAPFLALAGGLAYGEAVFALLSLAVLLACRRSFYRLSFFSTFSHRRALLIAVVPAAAIWAGFFAHRHVGYSNDLWWRFAFSADAPRFLRASLGMSLTFVVFYLLLWLRPSKLRADADLTREAVEKLVALSPPPEAALALLGDKKFFVHSDCEGAVMYAATGKFWVSMGDPIGREECAGDLIWQFCEEADRRGFQPVFYEAGEKWMEVYRDNDLHVAPLGETARVDLRAMPADFSGGTWKSLRAVRRKLQEEGCTFRVVEGEERSALMPLLREVSDRWLASMHGTEKRFSLGFFDEAYLSHFPVAIVEQDGKIRAFANLWNGAEDADKKRETAIDLMRYSPDAPENVMSFLFMEAMLFSKAAGYDTFRLGMAPLSNMDPGESLWEKAGAFVYRHGGRLYNFSGLRRYKEKFHPEWSPRYLVYSSTASLPQLLTRLLRLISRRKRTKKLFTRPNRRHSSGSNGDLRLS